MGVAEVYCVREPYTKLGALILNVRSLQHAVVIVCLVATVLVSVLDTPATVTSVQ